MAGAGARPLGRPWGQEPGSERRSSGLPAAVRSLPAPPALDLAGFAGFDLRCPPATSCRASLTWPEEEAHAPSSAESPAGSGGARPARGRGRAAALPRSLQPAARTPRTRQACVRAKPWQRRLTAERARGVACAGGRGAGRRGAWPARAAGARGGARETLREYRLPQHLKAFPICHLGGLSTASQMGKRGLRGHRIYSGNEEDSRSLLTTPFALGKVP